MSDNPAPQWTRSDASRAARVRLGRDSAATDVLWFNGATSELTFEALIEAWRRSDDETERLLAECEDLAWSLRTDSSVWGEVLGASPGRVADYGAELSRSVTDDNLALARSLAAALLYVCAEVPTASLSVGNVRWLATNTGAVRDAVELRREFGRLLGGLDIALPADEAPPGPQHPQSASPSASDRLQRVLERLRVGRSRSREEEPPSRGPVAT